MIFYYPHIPIFVFFQVLVCSLLLRYMLKSSTLRMGVKTLYNKIINTFGALAAFRSCNCGCQAVLDEIGDFLILCKN